MAAGREFRRELHCVVWQAFHGDQTGKISQAQQEMMAAHAVLSKADLRGRGGSIFLGLIRFRRRGQRIAAKLLPVASGVAAACGEGHHFAGTGTRCGKAGEPGGAGCAGTGSTAD